MVQDPWGVERVREHDGRIAASGRQLITTAIEHRPLGTLVGLSEGDVVAVQEGTLMVEEHRPMLDVNEAMGFVEIGREGGWQKRL